MTEQLAAQNLLLEKMTLAVGELPASPVIVSAVMGLTADVNANLEELGKVLAADQALTAKVLKLSNSSFYGRSRSVGTLKEAILILGFYTLRSMVIATSTHSLYSRKGNDRTEQKLWEHSLACAIACRLVGNQVHYPQVEEAFIAGLLHDIGKMVLGQRLGDTYRKLVIEVEAQQRSFAEVEEERLGFNHADVGLTILNKWNFPANLVAGVRDHHSNDIDMVEPKTPPIATVVQFSNSLAKMIGVGFHDFCESDLPSLPYARRFGLTEESIAAMIEELKAHYASEKQLFEEN